MFVKKYFIIIVILLLSCIISCSRCSNERSSDMDNTSQVVDAGSVVQSTVGEDVNIVSSSEESQRATGIRQTNIQFVKTADGEVVPEPILRLKVPNILNPQVLRNAIKQQDTSGEKGVDKKE